MREPSSVNTIGTIAHDPLEKNLVYQNKSHEQIQHKQKCSIV